MLKQAIFLGSYLLVPALLWFAFCFRRFPRWRFVSLICFLVGGLGVYVRFIEPQRLTVAEHTIEVCGDGLPGTLRAAVVSDFHYGIHRNTVSAARIVNRINREGVDLVLMPGDFTETLEVDRFESTFAPFAGLEAEAFAVLGNHDVGIGSVDVSDPLTEVLEAAGVTVLNPGEAVFQKNGKFLRIVGFRDYWAHLHHGQPLGPMASAHDMPVIFLQHNPDMIRDSNIGHYDLTVSGHTHGGQVYIPGVTCALTFACDTLRYGYAETPVGKIFVTSGIGMVGLPIRFNVPPRIDILNMNINRCRLPTFERLQRRNPHGRNTDEHRHQPAFGASNGLLPSARVAAAIIPKS